MEKEEKKYRGFRVEKNSFFVHVSVTILAVSIVIRLLGTIGMWSEAFSAATQIILPVVSALLFIAFILLLGRAALWSTILPVLGGAAFFILAATGGTDHIRMIVCVVLAFAASFVYTATLTNMLRTKWILAALLVLILGYQIAFIAVPAFGSTEPPVSFVDGMDILSRIGAVLALLFAALAIHRAKRELKEEPEEELPKIKDPVVIPPSGREDEKEQPEPAPQTTEPIETVLAESVAGQPAPETETVVADVFDFAAPEKEKKDPAEE